MSCCPVCDLRGRHLVTGGERLRGFEIELSSQRIEELSLKGTCKDHLRKCDGRCRQRVKKVDEPCDCKLCLKERVVPAVPEKLECLGHPCLDEGAVAAGWLAELMVAKSGVPVNGAFNNWRRTPRNNPFWDLKTDSSCGYEIATPPWSGKDARQELEKGLMPLVELERMHPKWKSQDERCGLHCTVDVSDQGLRGVKRILLLTVRHQSALLGTQPRYRWNNGNCRRLGEVWLGTANKPGLKRRITYVQSAGRLVEVVPEKYFIVNTRKYSDGEGLLEFRFGGATVDPLRVAAYGILVECLVQAAIERPAVVETSDRKKRLYKEVIEPYIKDPRVQEAWEKVLWPALSEVQLAVDPKAPNFPKRTVDEAMRERGLY